MTTESTPRFFASRWNKEKAAFLKVIRALPAGNLDYRPHERSTAAGDLAWQIAVEATNIPELIQNGRIDFKIPARLSTTEEIAGVFEKASEQVTRLLERTDESKWGGKVTFAMEGMPDWEATLEEMCWGYLFDMIHHRGQLSTYIRPMGGKVPAIYGPSADDAGM